MVPWNDYKKAFILFGELGYSTHLVVKMLGQVVVA